MKTLIAALALSFAVVSSALPASAHYTAPNASWVTKALSGFGTD